MGGRRLDVQLIYETVHHPRRHGHADFDRGSDHVQRSEGVMPRWLNWIRRKPPAFEFIDAAEEPRLVFARSCFDGLLEALGPANERRHEGVALLLGKIDEGVGLAVHTVRPHAVT